MPPHNCWRVAGRKKLLRFVCGEKRLGVFGQPTVAPAHPGLRLAETNGRQQVEVMLPARQRWRKLRAAALALRLLRSRRSAAPPTARRTAVPRDAFPFEPDACCAQRKKTLLRRIIAKPVHCRSDVDVKLLAGLLRHCRFNAGLSSASTDALARLVHFRVVHDGEIVFRQGEAIGERSERVLVIDGSLLEFSQQQLGGRGPQTSRADGRFGECVGTCNPGCICGEDAITGAIVRKTTALAQTTTLVAFVTKADYLRVARFNVEAEAKVLSDIQLLFNEPASHSAAPLGLDPELFHDRHAVRVVKRFLHRYECFRMLPQKFLLPLAHKLQLHAFKPGERFLDGVPKMIFVVSGECCVHVSETIEEGQLKAATADRKYKRVSDTRTVASHDNDCVCCSKTHDHVPGVIPSDHLCTLSGGDTFGESYLFGSSQSSSRISAEGVTLLIPRTGSEICYAVSVSVDDFFAARKCYLEATSFTTSTAYSILSSKLPHDRTCEQLSYVAAYLTRHSPAKSLFSQFPLVILREICLHATLEEYPTNQTLLACIQDQGKDVTSFRIILEGYVAVFKDLPCASQTTGLRSSQTKILGGARASSQASLHRLGGNNQPLHSCGDGCDNFVGALRHGTAFGLLPLLLGSMSSFGYVAYTAAGSSGTTTKILSIPTPVAKLRLAAIDEFLVCHPLRALKHAARTMRCTPCLQLSDPRKRHAMKEFERLILHCPAVSGIPQPTLRTMIEHMRVVNVPDRYFLFEAGEVTKGCIFIILEGSVRTYRCPLTDSNRYAKSSNRSQDGAKDFLELVLEATEHFSPEEVPDTTEHAMFTFNRPVDDDFFARDYKYVKDLGEGDGFGRHGMLGVSQGAPQPSTSSHSSRKLSTLVRRATSCRLRTQHQSPAHSVYPETAITVSNCRIGILWRDSTEESAFKLTPEQKTGLVASLEARENGEANGRLPFGPEEANTFPTGTCCQIIERMDLAKWLNTRQLLQAANTLKYVKVSSGDTVYRCGEEGTSMYFVLSGGVRLSNGRVRSATTAKCLGRDDFWSIDLCEGDVFGAEALAGGTSSTSRRLTTAVADAGLDSSSPVSLIYFSLDDYLAVSSPWEWFSQVSGQSLGLPRKTNGLQYNRSLVHRWKAAVFQITRVRPRWSSVLYQGYHSRTELTFGMVHHLPLFKDIPKQECIEVCKYCLVEAASFDSIIFKRGDDVLDQLFLVIEGSVTIQQLLAPIPATSAANAGVSVRVFTSGDSFGEVEIMLETCKRLVDAIVSSTGTMLLRVPKAVFFKFWPQREHFESKLTTLKRAFDAASPLETEQLCSMYYSVKECSFKRNEVVLGGNTLRGTLLIIESGICVVHDYITLQRRQPRNSAQQFPLQSRNCTPKLALDTPVATIGPTTILFAEELDSNASPRVGSEGEYIVAESPIVNAFSVELYPRNSGAASPRRNQDFLVAALLGRGGLQTVRSAIAAQRHQRAQHMGYSIRLAEAATSKEKPAPLRSPRVSPLKRAVQKADTSAPEKLQGPPMQMELLHYLRDRHLPNRRQQPQQGREPSSFLTLMGPTMGVPVSPTKLPGSSMGSFVRCGPTTNAKTLFPALVGSSDYCPEIQTYVDPVIVAASMRSAQLIKETRAIAELSHLPHKPIFGPKLDVATEKRQRHGRPPSRQVESRGRLIDVLTPDTNFENDRKRSGLCRRLLHLKYNDGHN